MYKYPQHSTDHKYTTWYMFTNEHIQKANQNPKSLLMYGSGFKHGDSLTKVIFNKGKSVSGVQIRNKLIKLNIWIKLYKYQGSPNIRQRQIK